ncbi:MAG TPA: PLP-dependent aminotransferase family protein, partial [Solirubrobacteraceae bacterium]|nr:PLP-dependent aminotransferase family protein [Solirubrobacteraceae bacterium]
PAPDLAWQAVALGPAIVDSGGLEALLADGGEDAILLSSGFPGEELLPVKALAAATSRAARRPGAWGRPPAEGTEELRSWFARDTGAAVDPADVVITAGAQAALATLMRALGRPGDPIVFESPTYLGALAAARAVGLVPVPVPVDHEGVRTDLLADTLARTRARLIFLQPLYANPHASVLSAPRRQEVLELAAGHGAFVIEDDYVRELWLEKEPPPPPLIAADPHGHVIYVRSLSKSTAASLRIAGVVARGPAGERLRRARIVDDFFVSAVLQHTAVELVTSPAWGRHLRQLRGALRNRRDILIDALSRHVPDWQLFQRPRGGLSLWLRLPPGSDERAVVRGAEQVGVTLMPGAPWFPAEPPGPYVRLSYAAAPEHRLREAAQRLARVSGA